MLPKSIQDAIERDYSEKIQNISYLSQGDNGSISRIQFESGRTFCVKSIRKTNDTFKNDSEICSAVYEPEFTVRTYEDHEFFHFTMPYFSGKSLAAIIKTMVNDDLILRLEVYKQVIAAMLALHHKGIIHRDLKPDNIIINITENRIQAFIIDFGRSIRIFNAAGTIKGQYIENLELPNSSNLFYQVARKFQQQNAPEHCSIGQTFLSFFMSAKDNSSIGFRSDYYGIATAFQQLVPEYAALATKVITSEGVDRNTAFHEFCRDINQLTTHLYQKEPTHTIRS